MFGNQRFILLERVTFPKATATECLTRQGWTVKAHLEIKRERLELPSSVSFSDNGLGFSAVPTEASGESPGKLNWFMAQTLPGENETSQSTEEGALLSHGTRVTSTRAERYGQPTALVLVLEPRARAASQAKAVSPTGVFVPRPPRSKAASHRMALAVTIPRFSA